MIGQDLLLTVHALSDEDRRELIAHTAGVQAHKDGDGGLAVSRVLRRVADRLTGQPRRAVSA